MSSPHSPSELKRDIRRRTISMREEMEEEEVVRRSEEIRGKVLEIPEIRNAHVIMLYASKGKEVRTDELISDLLRLGKRVVLPKTNVEGKEIIPIEILDPEKDLVIGNYGIREPRDEAKRVDPEEIEVAVVPGVAFDRNGNRIGRGAGYYDRFLAEIRGRAFIIALAFGFQIVDKIPSSDSDVPVDLIVTEEATYRVRKRIGERGLKQ